MRGVVLELGWGRIRDSCVDLVRHLITAIASVLLISVPVQAQSAWQDISAEVAKAIGIPSLYDTWYLRKGSRKTIKSVERKGTIYESAEFSYTSLGETRRRKFYVDCRTASYKDSLKTKGYLGQMTYIAFDGDKLYNGGESDGWFAYRYLCPKATNPWMTISENSAGEKYGINIATAVRLADRPYKHAYFFIASAIKEIGPPEIMGLYVACIPRRATFRSVDDIVNTFPQSDELNPNSVGEDIAHIICSSLGHK